MSKPTPTKAKHLLARCMICQPQTMVSGRVFNYQGRLHRHGRQRGSPIRHRRAPGRHLPPSLERPGAIAPGQDRTDLPERYRRIFCAWFQVVSRGGNSSEHLGRKGTAPSFPTKPMSCMVIGKLDAISGEAVYGTEPQPFRPSRLLVMRRRNRESLPHL